MCFYSEDRIRWKKFNYKNAFHWNKRKSVMTRRSSLCSTICTRVSFNLQLSPLKLSFFWPHSFFCTIYFKLVFHLASWQLLCCCFAYHFLVWDVCLTSSRHVMSFVIRNLSKSFKLLVTLTIKFPFIEFCHCIFTQLSLWFSHGFFSFLYLHFKS